VTEPGTPRVAVYLDFDNIVISRYDQVHDRFGNLYFAGNYRTFPSVLSTGTALASGLEAAQTVLRDRGTDTLLPDAVAAFRR
jgi:hypothetical protein